MEAIRKLFQEINQYYSESPLVGEVVQIHSILYQLIDAYLDHDTTLSTSSLAELDSEINQVENSIQQQIIEIQQMRIEHEELSIIISDRNKQLEALVHQSESRKKNYYQKQEQLTALIANRKAYETEIEELKDKVESLNSNLDGDKTTLDQRYKQILLKARNIQKFYPFTNYLAKHKLETIPEAEIMNLLIHQSKSYEQLKGLTQAVQPVNLMKYLQVLLNKGIVSEKGDQLVIPSDIVDSIKAKAI